VKRATTHSQEQPNKSNLEERFRTDIQVRHFKKWIRSHYQPQNTNFFKRFLADGQLPEHASRGLYEAKMRSAGNYSDEDMQLIQDGLEIDDSRRFGIERIFKYGTRMLYAT
jgi:hypothetical protein